MAQTIGDVAVSARELALLEAGETPKHAWRPLHATGAGGERWDHPLLLLTNRRMLLIKDRLFGKPRADYAVAWPDVHRVSGDGWNGSFAYIQLDVQSAAGDFSLVMTPTHAADAEAAIRAGYVR
jgi:hypothetical protein